MCHGAACVAGNGWRGWPRFAARHAGVPVGEWHDLTWPLSPTVPRIASVPPPRISRIRAIPEQPLNISELQLVVHTGTHVDSPRHFYTDGPAFEDIPLERLMGPGLVWRIDKPLGELIEPDDLEKLTPAIQLGDIVAIDTGAQARVGKPDYDLHPFFSVAAAEWLVARQTKMLAIDNPTPDAPLERRPSDFNWPVHRALLSAGVLIAEQVTNLSAFAGRRVEFLFCCLNIVDCDGSPARVLARQVAA
jgi:kynurenine formamidase